VSRRCPDLSLIRPGPRPVDLACFDLAWFDLACFDLSSRIFGFQLLTSTLQPVGQFVAVGEHAAAAASRQPVDGESAFAFPTLDRALGATEEGGNLLPRIQTLADQRVVISCHKGK
jgi:hypothetical protein